jgi:hypothetical protein
MMANAFGRVTLVWTTAFLWMVEAHLSMVSTTLTALITVAGVASALSQLEIGIDQIAIIWETAWNTEVSPAEEVHCPLIQGRTQYLTRGPEDFLENPGRPRPVVVSELWFAVLVRRVLTTDAKENRIPHDGDGKDENKTIM